MTLGEFTGSASSGRWLTHGDLVLEAQVDFIAVVEHIIRHSVFLGDLVTSMV